MYLIRSLYKHYTTASLIKYHGLLFDIFFIRLFASLRTSYYLYIYIYTSVCIIINSPPVYNMLLYSISH